MTQIAPDFPEARFVEAGDVRLAVYEDGPADGLPIILIHGWPEIAYSWKHTMKALAGAGYRAIAPDLKGFGLSDAPRDPALYDIRHMTDDLAGLLNALSIDQAVFCGHDWGGAIVWPMAQVHGSRVAGVIGVSTPHRPPPPVAPLAILEKRFGPDHYIVRFQEPDAPEATLARDIDQFFTLMFRGPAPRSAWPGLVPRIFDLLGRLENGPAPNPADCVLSAEDRAVFKRAYERSGFHGGINLYRNIDRNYAIMEDRDPRIAQPALWIGADLDLFLPPEGAEAMTGLAPDLEKHVIDDCGHWVMWEQPEALNALIIDWLRRRF